jgi:hypothetical protein
MLALALSLAIFQNLPEEVSIRGKTADSEIVIRANSRFAGAIYSLTWRGKEFLDSADHGRELQSASNFDSGTAITNETFNPTEAGSMNDGAGQSSSSRLLRMVARGNRLETRTQMAFWLDPTQQSNGQPAKNRTVLSNHILSKRVTIGHQNNPRHIRYEVTFKLPPDEAHTRAVFESLTGYMPPEFSEFWRFDPKSKTLVALSDGPGEQSDPVVFSTKDGAFAMGIYTPDVRTKGYGRWRFAAERVVKWNCVFRATAPIAGKQFSFVHDLSVGTLAEVESDLRAWSRQ